MKRKSISILFALVLVFTLGLVTAVPAAADDITVNPGDSIQDAIDAANPGDTIIVSDGTYQESLVVNIADLTLKSASGSANTTIQNVGNAGGEQTGFLLMAGATNFTLGGSEGHGFTIEGGTNTAPRLIQLNNGPSGVELSYNTFDSSDTNGTISTGINIGAGGATGLTVDNNIFITDEDDIYQDWPLTSGGPLTNLTVTYNEFTGSGTPDKYGAAIDLNQSNEATALLSGGTITNNTISGFDQGILTGSGDAIVENLDIIQNDISGCGKGIMLRGTNVDMDTLTVTENNIHDNTLYGIENTTSIVVTAKNNWWGTVNGPGHAGNTFNVGAQGDASSDNVDYVPWLDATYATGASFAPVTVGTGTTYHSSIQAGIDAAIEGDIITCKAGEFTEDLAINTANLTLKSVSGMASTTIQLVDGYGIEVQGTAAKFTLGGAAGAGFEILGGTGTTHMIVLPNNPHPTTISYCALDLAGNPSQGITCGAASLEDLTVDHCTFNTSEESEVVIYGENVHDSLISNCEFIGAGSGTSTGTGIMIWGCPDMTYSNNEFRDIGTGISIWGNSLIGEIDNNIISGCTFTDCARGLWLGEGAANKIDITGVTVTGNIFDDNAKGIRIESSTYIEPSGFVIEYNNFSGNTYAVDNVDEEVTAENNWWGNASGPVPSTLPATGYNSYGDAVSDSTKIDYQPWLLAEVEEGVTPTMYEYTLALKDGWTLASVDKEVATGTAWVGTTALVDTETIVAYKYTAGTGYSQVTLATQLTSVDAYYVKTDDGGGVGINYSTAAPGVVTKSLGAGWNIISCASETHAYELLSQLRYVQVGEQEGVGITNLIGQASYNQYIPTSMSIPLVTDADWTAIKGGNGGAVAPLNAFDGYWVYMNAAKSFGVIPD